jgi:sugar lactone lactonase YvrE
MSMSQYKVERVLDAKAEIGECPIWSSEDQRLYWIDINRQAFNRFDPKTGENQRASLPKMPGSYVLREGGGVVMAMQDGFYDYDPATERLEKRADAPYDTSRIRFNDGKADRQGRYWVGSMMLDMLSPEHEGAFYCYDGQSVKKRISPIHHANGTVFSLDGKTMYRAETMDRKIYAYDVDTATGEVSGERLFAVVPDSLGLPDGATIDSEGGYWAALPAGPNGGGVGRFTPDGKFDFHIDMPVLLPLMPAFGGPDMATLYVTSGTIEHVLGKEPTALSGSLFAVQTPFRGVPEPKFRSR